MVKEPLVPATDAVIDEPVEVARMKAQSLVDLLTGELDAKAAAAEAIRQLADRLKRAEHDLAESLETASRRMRMLSAAAKAHPDVVHIIWDMS